MSVKFTWKGSVEKTDGLAIYSTQESDYEIWLPTFEKAQELDSVFRDIFAEGRRIGHREMMQDVSNVMNVVLRKL